MRAQVAVSFRPDHNTSRTNCVHKVNSISLKTYVEQAHTKLHFTSNRNENMFQNQYISLYRYHVGRDSSVGRATRYGLDGLGIKSRCGQDFLHLSRPALGPSQPPVQWVPGIFRAVRRPGRGADHPPSSSVLRS